MSNDPLALPIPAIQPPLRSKPSPYEPAVKPWLRPLLWFIFAGFAVLGATGAYLAGISFLNWLRPASPYTTGFTFWMFLSHEAIGVMGAVPFLIFGVSHYVTSRRRPNRKAVRLGLIVFTLGIATVATGLALFQFEALPQLPTGSLSRSAIYWLHVFVPVLAVVAYVGHRRAGPRIQWGYGKVWGGAVIAL